VVAEWNMKKKHLAKRVGRVHHTLHNVIRKRDPVSKYFDHGEEEGLLQSSRLGVHSNDWID